MIIIAIGSNLPGKWGNNSYDMCQMAIHRLINALSCDDVIVSSWYQTTPIPPSSQPLYINGAIAFEKKIACVDLLSILHIIEKEAGRIRQKSNEARPLDLDIISFNNEIINNPPALIVPHPRAHLRAFVLYPLRDIAPDWIHPIYQKNIEQLIKGIPEDQGISLYQSKG